MEQGISVVIPAYNAKCYVEQALSCVCAQSYNKYEVIFVENGSSDNTFELAEKFRREHSQKDISVIRVQPNQGISGARNIGTEKAKYEYVAYLDVDDIWYPNKLQVVNETINQNPDGDVFCHWERVTGNGYEHINKYRKVNNKNAYFDLLKHGNKLSGSATTVRKKKMMEIGGFERRYISGEEDYDCWMRLAERNAVFVTVPEILGEYRLHSENLSGNFEKHEDAILNMVLGHIDELVNSGKISKARYKQMRRIVEARCLYAKGRCFFNQKHDKKQALHFLKKSIKRNPFYWKAYIAIILACFNK